MPLAAHDENFRRTWMFPRNIRKIPPWKMSKILLIFSNKNKINWISNQNIQDEFYKTLEKIGLKRTGFQRHANPGGARTYYSQLKTLGLIFSRKIEGKKYDFTTLAGDSLIKGENPLDVMQYVLLKHQYPSYYSQGHNVMIHPNIKVKPFIFILQLLNIEGINKLSTEEIALAVTYGHNNECLDLVAEKIFVLREVNDFKTVLNNPEKDLYTPRGSDDLSNKIANVKDVANTCKNYMESCLLVHTKKEGRKEYIVFNEDIREKYLRELEFINDFISVDSEEHFQRRYGCYGRQKDTRVLRVKKTGEYQTEAVDALNNLILSEFFDECGSKKIKTIPEEFLINMQKKWGLDKDKIREVVEPYLEKALDIFESTFLDISRGGKSSAIEFEKVLTDLFRDEFYFEAEHTGQKTPPAHRRGGYADIFLVALDEEHCALVDAKSTSSYSLPVSDYNSMLNIYIPYVDELIKDRNLKLEFCLYAAHGYSNNINEKLIEMSRQAPCSISAVKAKTLLDLTEKIKNKRLQLKLREGFRKNGLVNIENFDVS